MPEAKPSDFFLGVTEFFVILLPGATLVYLIQPWTSELLPARLLPRDHTTGRAVFLTVGYVAGHMLHAVAGKLDLIYDRLYLLRFRPNHYQALALIRKKDLQSLKENENTVSTLAARTYFQAGGASAGTSLYDWYLSLARLKNSSAAGEVDRYDRFLGMALLRVALACDATNVRVLFASSSAPRGQSRETEEHCLTSRSSGCPPRAPGTAQLSVVMPHHDRGRTEMEP